MELLPLAPQANVSTNFTIAAGKIHYIEINLALSITIQSLFHEIFYLVQKTGKVINSFLHRFRAAHVNAGHLERIQRVVPSA